MACFRTRLGLSSVKILAMARDAHIFSDPTTSRDLFGVVRSRCTGCQECGRYLIQTRKYHRKTSSADQRGSVHPDCNVRLLDCDRCGCPADVHEVNQAESARERGNDALSVGEYDQAINFYSDAISQLGLAADWRLYSNRALSYSKKLWWAQALSDAERACSLNNEAWKVQYRRAVALAGLHRYKEALEACERASERLVGEGLAEEDRKAVRSLRAEILGKLGAGKKKAELERKGEEERKAERPDARQQQLGGSPVLRRLEQAMNELVEAQRRSESRLDRMESMMKELLVLLMVDGREGEDVVRDAALGASVDKNDDDAEGEDTRSQGSSATSASMSASSDLSEAIEELERAWEQHLSSNGHETAPEGPPFASPPFSSPPCPSSPSTSSSSPSSQHPSSRKSTAEYLERQARVAAAKERIAAAEAIGELLMTSDVDILLQLRRGACSSEDCGCEHFTVQYRSCDVHDTDVMLFCSVCGCAAIQHEIDTEWARKEAEK